MHSLIELLVNHRSERSFTDMPISDEILNNIVEAAYRAPTSVNSQQVSIVVVQDQARREKIAKIAGGQPWIARAPVFITVLLDLRKAGTALEMLDKKQVTQETIEGIISGSTDVGIALGALMTAARAQGLGIVPIGGIRNDPDAMIELLNLPLHVFPLVGVSIGYVDQPSSKKPRLPLSTFRHNEFYQTAELPIAIASYNQTISAYWQDIGRTDGLPWGENTATYHKYNYFPKVKPTLIKQGFSLKE
ncbi:NADPH-dependent oxidoreductase [Gammaproteobacteria bacterium]|nr:NADPH-dependent oxidoreductase [Gammaproteobacteria bacterium]